MGRDMKVVPGPGSTKYVDQGTFLICQNHSDPKLMSQLSRCVLQIKHTSLCRRTQAVSTNRWFLAVRI